MLASVVGAILFVDAAVIITWGGTSPHAQSPTYTDVPGSPIAPLPAELVSGGAAFGPAGMATVVTPASLGSGAAVTPASPTPSSFLPAIQSGLPRSIADATSTTTAPNGLAPILGATPVVVAGTPTTLVPKTSVASAPAQGSTTTSSVRSSTPPSTTPNI